ncbi:MAG TPA: 50S ribosomal protein L25 [Deinococcales bacterium]|nr:50S ribosomal protein L25 [Deinococcales bacterium]
MELKVIDRTGKPTEAGLIPAVVYGHGTNRNIYVDLKSFDRAFRQASTNGVITLAFEGGEKLDTMVKAVSMDKRRRVAQHADFYVVTDEPVVVSVPVHAVGDAPGVKAGGVLDLVLHSVAVKASPKKVPSAIDVDVSGLGINEPLHARDLKLPQGVELTIDPDLTVVTIHPPRQEVEETPDAGASEPEVIAKGKADEE